MLILDSRVQEMIFACALYPRDRSFLDLVSTEVGQQVARLATHPSIVIWGGSNENEYAMTWYNESKANRDLYVADYNQANKLYRNDGDGTFSEVSSIAGVDDEGGGRGVAWGDYDGTVSGVRRGKSML